MKHLGREILVGDVGGGFQGIQLTRQHGME
jgi:hypothetical protein